MNVSPQDNAPSQTREIWDAIVIGAGPAGTLAARQLALEGLHVLLVEKKHFPRPKVCGACLNRHALDVLHSVGLSAIVEEGLPLDQLRLGMSGRIANLRLPEGVAISRYRFDHQMLNAATDAGVTVMQETLAGVLGVENDCRKVELSRFGTKSIVEGRVVIVASGLATNLAHEPDLTTRVATDARLGASCSVKDFPSFYERGVIFMAVGRHGYVGLTRVDRGELNIAAAFDGLFLKREGSPARAVTRILREAGYPELPGLAEAAWMGTIPLTRTTRPVAINRLMLIGDATGYVEPFTGEGMAWGLASGLAAANLLIAHSLQWNSEQELQWIQEFERHIGRRQRVCRVLASLLRRPLLARIAFEAARLVPNLAGVLIRSVNRPPLLSHAS